MAPEFAGFIWGFLLGGGLIGVGVGVVVKYISKQEVKITYNPRVISRTEEEEADLEVRGESGTPGRDFENMRAPNFMRETGEEEE